MLIRRQRRSEFRSRQRPCMDPCGSTGVHGPCHGRGYCCRRRPTVSSFPRCSPDVALRFRSSLSGKKKRMTATNTRWLQQLRRYGRASKAIILPSILTLLTSGLRPASCQKVIRSRRRPERPFFCPAGPTPLSTALDAIYNR